MEEAEKLITLIKTVATDTQWNKKFGWHQVNPALAKMEELVRIGFLAKKSGFTIVKEKDGAFALAAPKGQPDDPAARKAV